MNFLKNTNKNQTEWNGKKNVTIIKYLRFSHNIFNTHRRLAYNTMGLDAKHATAPWVVYNLR